jgi:hypothetical protein
MSQIDSDWRFFHPSEDPSADETAAWMFRRVARDGRPRHHREAERCAIRRLSPFQSSSAPRKRVAPEYAAYSVACAFLVYMLPSSWSPVGIGERNTYPASRIVAETKVRARGRERAAQIPSEKLEFETDCRWGQKKWGGFGKHVFVLSPLSPYRLRPTLGYPEAFNSWSPIRSKG